jgi:uncharacterized protein YndB with AHSA1/START domain
LTSTVFVSLRVPAGPARTFDAFTREIASWWRPSGLFEIGRKADGSGPRGDGMLAFEPGAGGRLYTKFADGQEFEIGRVSVWEPGRRLVFNWRQASFPPEQSTEVEVLFEAVGDQTRVSVEHRAWDTIPRTHVARHGFPENATLQRVAEWWQVSLAALKDGLRA